MKHSPLLLVLMLCASPALADPPSQRTEKDAKALVNAKLLRPLARAESKRSKFSRAAPTPVKRRVRVVDQVASKDARGKRFVRFAVDARRRWDEEGSWQEAEIVGCAYLDSKKVFIKRGDGYVPARGAIGKKAKPWPGVCRTVGDETPQLASARGLRQ